MKNSSNSSSFLRNLVHFLQTLVYLSVLLPIIAEAQKPETPPGLMEKSIVRSQGIRTTIMGSPHLTKPAMAQPRDIARQFIRDQKEIFGLSDDHIQQLKVKKSFHSKHNKASHVYMEQEIDGIRVSGTGLTFTIDAIGRIVFAGGSVSQGEPTGFEVVSGAEAVELAGKAANVQIPLPLNELPPRGQQLHWENTFAEVNKPNNITAELIYRVISPEVLLLIWEVDFEVDGSRWLQSFVDAETGEVVDQFNRYVHSHGPEGTVFTDQHPDVSGPRELVPFSGVNGTWVTGRVSSGNNVTAYRDLLDINLIGIQPTTPAIGNPLYQHFTYTWTDAWRMNADGSISSLDADLGAIITQLFYYVNDMHDWAYSYGFDEQSGNFQVNNFGRGGVQGDPVLAEAQNGWLFGCVDKSKTPPEKIRCKNKANFVTPNDGKSPRLQMYMYAPGSPYRDSSMDGDIIAHEYGHGISGRLVGGGKLGYFDHLVHGALGEGWSDIISFLKWGDAVVGEYISGNTARGIRGQPYDNSPRMYSDYSPESGTHGNGENWATMVYDVRAALGLKATTQLVIEGMKNTPALPNFMDARNGILIADITDNAGANNCLLWGIFASRGLGVNAAFDMNSSTSPANNFDLPAGCAPTADAGGPYQENEGTDVILDATGSTPSAAPSAGSIALYEWDLDNDGDYDDAVGSNPSFTMVGDNASFTIGLRVTNDAGITDEDSTTITISNVKPSVNLTPISSVSENTSIQLNWTVTDPGWLDSLTATVDWGDGLGVQALAGSIENARPDATLSGATSHVYGDNGSYIIQVCGSDDDGGTSCSNVVVTITNIDPTANLGKDTYIAHANEDVTVTGDSTDPGSDDLHAVWDWDITPLDPAVSKDDSLVNDPLLDPAKSPSIQPRDVDWSATHTYSQACLYDLKFTVTDDDAGKAEDTAVVIITGNDPRVRSSGYWMNQYRPKPPNNFTTGQLVCYLKIVSYLSDVFDEVSGPLSTRAHAVNVLFVKGNKGSAEQLFDEQLLASWLNFANGAYDLNSPFENSLRTAEAVRLNPTASREELLFQKDILEKLVNP